MEKSGRCRQVFLSFWTRFRWPLVVVDRWSLFRGRITIKIAWAGFRVVVVDRWSLFGGGRYSEVVVNTGLTVYSKCLCSSKLFCSKLFFSNLFSRSIHKIDSKSDLDKLKKIVD